MQIAFGDGKTAGARILGGPLDRLPPTRHTSGMRGVPKTYAAVADGLAAEMSLLEEVARGDQPAAMIWAAGTRALTLPDRFSRGALFATAAEASDRNGWPVVTRRTGGGITPQGPGVLNVALAFQVPPKDAKSVSASYAAICDPLIHVLAEFDVAARTGSVKNSFCDGDFNLEVDDRKLVGTAQRWRGASVLCHALILIDLDLGAAVTAAQSLADGLDLGDTYHREAHTRLADCLVDSQHEPADVVNRLTQHLDSSGFRVV